MGYVVFCGVARELPRHEFFGDKGLTGEGENFMLAADV